MVDDINFLPAGYHHSRHRRKKQAWRRGAFVAVLLLIFAGSAKQWHARRALEATRDELRRRAADSLAQLGPAEALNARIARLDSQTTLLVRLQTRVPPTRLLADVTRSLPEFVSLTQFRVHREGAAPLGGLPAALRAGTQPAPEATAPAEKDLDELQRLDEQSHLVVSLLGIAPDDVAISHFLAAMQETGTFAEVQLQYTDETTFREYRLRSFSIRLVVRRPGSMAGPLPADAVGMRGQP